MNNIKPYTQSEFHLDSSTNNSYSFSSFSNSEESFALTSEDEGLFYPETLENLFKSGVRDAARQAASRVTTMPDQFDFIKSADPLPLPELETALSETKNMEEIATEVSEGGELAEAGLSGGALAIPLIVDSYLSSRQIAAGEEQNQIQYINDKFGNSSAGTSFMASAQAEANLAYRDMMTKMTSGLGGLPSLVSSFMPTSAPDIMVQANSGQMIPDSQIN